MARYFFDTSALVKHYHAEAGTDVVDRVIDEPGAELIIARLTLVETISVVAIKVRTGEFDAAEFARLRGLFATNMTVYITSCRGRLKPRPRTRFTFSSVALGTNRPRFYALVEQAHEFRQEDAGDPRVALEHKHALVVRSKQLQDVES
jgi:hypothetical protein